MNALSSRFVPAVAALTVAITTCIAAATVVQAQTPPPRGAPGEGRPPMPPGGPGMHMMREVERLKTALALNAQQAALWDRAVAAMKPQGDPRGQMKAQHERFEAMLADPAFDPRRMAAEMDRADTDRRAQMATVRDAWFAVYDSLNPAQRGQVREFLRERMSHRGHEGHGEHGMRGKMEWEHRDGDGGRPPMPQAAPPAPAR